MLVKNEVLLIKIESTYGTDAVPVAGTDAILVENPQWSHANSTMNDRSIVRPSHGRLQQVYGGTLKQITFDVEVKGPGASYSASVLPEIDVPLRACGMGATLVAATSVTYAPVSSGFESATIYYYQDGTLHKLLGCFGDVQFTFEAGTYGKASFTFTGHASATTDVALPSPTLDTVLPPAVLNSAFTIGGYAAAISNIAFGLNNSIGMPKKIQAADGFGDLKLTGRDVAGSFDPEAVLVATNDFDAQWKAGTSLVLASGTIGSATFNKYKIDMPAVSYREYGPGDREGIRTYDMSFGAAESTTDDEVSIEFT